MPADSIRCGVVSDEEEEEDDDVEKEEGEESDVIATAAPGDRDIWKEVSDEKRSKIEKFHSPY